MKRVVEVGQRFRSANVLARTWEVEAVMSQGLPAPHVRIRDVKDRTVCRTIAVSVLHDRGHFIPVVGNDG